jgi:hypothetical protein
MEGIRLWISTRLKDWKNAEMEWTKAIEYEKESRKKKKRGEVSDDELRFSLIVVKRLFPSRHINPWGGSVY